MSNRSLIRNSSYRNEPVIVRILKMTYLSVDNPNLLDFIVNLYKKNSKCLKFNIEKEKFKKGVEENKNDEDGNGNGNGNEDENILNNHFRDYQVDNIYFLSTYGNAHKWYMRKFTLNTIKNLTGLSGLTHLDCGFNNLDFLPSFKPLQSLKTFSCCNNHLKILPEDIENIISLQDINIAHNQFTELPVNIFTNLTNLIYFEGSGNKFKVLPSFENCVKLKYLYCSDNLLEEIPSLIHLHNLQSLILKKNELRRFPDFNYNENLEYADFSFNRINLEHQYQHNYNTSYSSINRISFHKLEIIMFPQKGNIHSYFKYLKKLNGTYLECLY